ncbi:uncharacterized protein Triagg1_10753 [Trichoderma aggressivum f. europaeum]|uniref:NADP-dependent oxidoreductase domain-containing protein n=1 Tax=Trichoderma aggressivum f. europaeum TaxID=173218 RepID=A0AAE1I6L7_9HYPO|nr:hypothetical protein Triagg1_10753 [Trichoderma aggressivum f. europaeum]
MGYRVIDTASSKRFHREKEDGNAISRFLANNENIACREALFVVSKFATPSDHEKPLPYEVADDIPSRILRSVLCSANNLHIDVIDAYFLHTPLRTHTDTLTAWRALERLVKQGGVRYLGISNVSYVQLKQLYNAAEIKPTFVQNWFRKESQYDGKVMAFCRDNDIVYQIFGLFDKANEELLQSEPVQRRAQEKSLSLHQALLQMLVGGAAHHGLRLGFLDGSTNLQHMRDNLSAVRQKLDDLEIQDLEMFWQLIGWSKSY